MRRIVLLAFCFLFFGFESNKKNNEIEVVLCVDLSASMNGLVENLRSDIWEIIYDFSRYYPAPKVKIGIIAYGRLTYHKENLYVKKFHDLTDFHDNLVWAFMKEHNQVSDGNSMVTAALEECVTNINWSLSNKVEKHIIVVGNGDIGMEKGLDKMVDFVVKKNIRISSLHYQRKGMTTYQINDWKDLAKKGKGLYAPFGFKKSDIVFHKKYDEKAIKEICDKINDTYIYYGKNGKEAFEKMLELDEFAKQSGGEVLEARAVYKASSFFQHRNESWDLVDLFTTKEVKLEKLKKEFLPEEIRDMEVFQLRDYIRLKKAERKALIAQLAVQNANRDLYLYRKRYKMGMFNTDKDFTTSLLLHFNKLFSANYRITY